MIHVPYGAVIVWLALLVLHGGVNWAAILQPVLVRLRGRSTSNPPTTIVMPLYGAEPELAENLDRVLGQDYPDFCVALALPREQDPAFGPAVEAMGRWPQVKSEIAVGESEGFPNRKVRNEFKCLVAARTDFVCIVDSNISLPPDALHRCMALMRSNVGLVSPLPVAVRANGFVGHLESALMNGYSTRFQLAASAIAMDKVMGKCMLVRWSDSVRRAVSDSFLHHAAEDQAVYSGVRAAGYAAAIADFTVECPIGARRWSQLWSRHSRWAMYRRMHLPAAFFAEPPIMLCCAASFAWLAAEQLSISPLKTITWTALYWLAYEALLHWCKGWPFQWHSPFFWLIREALLPFLWVRGLLNRTVHWRGQKVIVKPQM